MAWKDNLENIKFSIETGDNKIYYPKWRTANVSTEFNVSRFDFINVDGTLVKRKKRQGSVFNLNFFIDADQSREFELSTRDSRGWNIVHPIYGAIFGQPASVKRNDNHYSVTEYTIVFWESLGGSYPVIQISIIEYISSKAETVLDSSIDAYGVIDTPEVGDVSTTKNVFNFASANLSPDSDSTVSFNSKVKTANKSIDNLISDTETSAKNIQNVYMDSAYFTTPVYERVTNLRLAYFNIKSLLDNPKSFFNRFLFETQVSDIISAMIISASNPLTTDYFSRKDVLAISSIIDEVYYDYVTSLETVTDDIYVLDEKYAPTTSISESLHSLVLESKKSLFTIAFDAKQERTIELQQDSNIYLLTHKYMGSASEENIDTFKELNGIGLKEMFQLKKGRFITYFV